MNKPITSREYKLILNADRFRDRQQGIEDFRELFEYLVKEQGEELKKAEKEKKEEKRQTYYLDTVGLDFYQQGFILRVREEQQDIFKITLKYRHSDRYLSASKNLASQEEKCKFEEDILASGSSKFSHSVSLKNPENPSPDKIKTVENVIKLFPKLENDEDLKDIHRDAKIQVVNGFKAYEITHELGHFSIDGIAKA